MKLWPSAPGLVFVCSDPLCRLDYTAHIESDGKNVYMCFYCHYTLCIKCVENTYGTSGTQGERQWQTNVKIGDAILKLPPTYKECTDLHSQPPSYDVCTTV